MSGQGMYPARLLDTVSKSSAHLWRKVDDFRFRHVQEWDGRVFMPLDAWGRLVDAEFPELRRDRRHTTLIRFSTAGAWRPGQDIVRFDADFQRILCGTHFTGNLPVDVLIRLPAWCLYFDTGEMIFNGSPVAGFFSALEQDMDRCAFFLRLTFMGPRYCSPVLLPLGPWTLEHSLRLADELVARNRAGKGLAAEAGHSGMIDAALHAALNMILFVCSNEISNAKMEGFKRPEPKKVKKMGWRIFPPAKPRLHLIGSHAGAQIRQFRGGSGAGHAVSPHIRRAHWHGFWHGPLRGEREFRLRWLAPIPVNMRDDVLDEGPCQSAYADDPGTG